MSSTCKVLSHMGVRFLVFRDSFLLKYTWPFHNPFHNPFSWFAGMTVSSAFKALLTSLRPFCQSISSHHRLVSSLALCWNILLHGLPFIHALSYFPDPPSFSESLFFVFLIPRSPHGTVGPPAYHIYLCTGKKPNHIHSHPLFWLLKQITGSQYVTWHLKWSPARVSNISVIFWVKTMHVDIFPNCLVWFGWLCSTAQAKISNLLFIPKEDEPDCWSITQNKLFWDTLLLFVKLLVYVVCHAI